MKRFIGIPALALAVAVTSATAFAPSNAQAADTGDVLGILAGGLLVGSVIHKLNEKDSHVYVNRNSRHDARRHHQAQKRHKNARIQQRKHGQRSNFRGNRG